MMASGQRDRAMVTNRRSMFGSPDFDAGLAQSAVWLTLGVAALFVVSKFEQIFQDFGTSLPSMTIALLDLTHLLSRYWYLALLPVISWPFVNWGIVFLLSPRPEVVLPRRLWYFATWGVILLVVVFAMFALFRPLIVLISPLSGPVAPVAPLPK